MSKHFSTVKHDVWLPYKFAVGPAFHRFYEGLKEQKILGNQCPACARTMVPPRTFCPSCNVDMGEWVELPQEGEIVSWTWASKPFLGMPVDPPFVGALIRLDAANCNFLHLVGGFDTSTLQQVHQKIRTGSRVRAVWADERKGRLLDIAYFEPK